jgi:hypothetical protein
MKTVSFLATGIALLLQMNSASATHVYGGEITFERVPNSTEVKVTVTTLSNSEAVSADRDELTIYWGDGTYEDIRRSSKVDIANHTWRNKYKASHIYNSLGKYVISVSESNRGIALNMTDAIQSPFYIESVITLSSSEEAERSPVGNDMTVPLACKGNSFVHDLGAMDADGDSLALALINPLKGENEPVGGYSTPQATEYFTLSNTGVLTWETPLYQGVYAVAIRIDEYRAGKLIGYVIRDFQIIVEACNPSSINPVPDRFGMSVISSPAKDKISIRFSSPVKDKTIEIYDMRGRPLIRRENVCGDEISISTQGFSKGIYFVKLQGEGINSAARFIVR